MDATFERDKHWYRNVVCKHLQVHIPGSHFMLVPIDELDADHEEYDWRLLHAESMTEVEKLKLDEGETIEMAAERFGRIFYDAQVAAPMNYTARVEVDAATISARQQTRLASGSQTQGYAGDPYRESVR
jgi:hypothetical protein